MNGVAPRKNAAAPDDGEAHLITHGVKWNA